MTTVKPSRRMTLVRAEDRDVVDAVRVVLGLPPLYAPDAGPSTDHLVERSLPYGGSPAAALLAEAAARRLELVPVPPTPARPNAARPRVCNK